MLNDPKLMRFYAIMTGAVITKLALIAGGFFVGRWLDTRFGTAPIFLFLGLVLGSGLGLFWVIYIASRKEIRPSSES